MRGRIAIFVALAAIAGATYLVTPAASKRPKPPLCASGRYVVDGKVSLIATAAPGHPEMLVIEASNVSLSSGCPPAMGTMKISFSAVSNVIQLACGEYRRRTISQDDDSLDTTC